MKAVELKETTMTQGEETLSYGDLLLVVVNTPVKEGFTYEDVRIRTKILDKLENKEKLTTLEFEDTEMSVIKKGVREMKWNAIHKDIVDFSDYILSL